MEFINPELTAYVEAHTQEEAEVLKALNRETNAKVLMPRMLSGHFQGQLLRILSYMIQPEQILEIGTYTGYSAICLSSGLKKGGLLHTIEINAELEEMIKYYFAKAGVDNTIKLYLGDAQEIIPTIDKILDIVFIDADKKNYSNYYDLIFDKVRVGGYIIADNVLWSGKVLENPEKMDQDTIAIVKFNEKLQNDERVENILLPIRDGLMIARKIK